MRTLGKLTGEQIAGTNGIGKKLYRLRKKVYKWSDKRATTEPVNKNHRGDKAVYRNDELIAMGSLDECAEQLGVSKSYLCSLTTPSHKKRLASRVDQTNATQVIDVED